MKSSKDSASGSRSAANAAALRLDQLGDGDALGLGGQHVLERVVVGAALEPHLVTGQPVVPGQHVGLDQLERVAEVGRALTYGIVVLR